jgi:hypothetical protein
MSNVSSDKLLDDMNNIANEMLNVSSDKAFLSSVIGTTG